MQLKKKKTEESDSPNQKNTEKIYKRLNADENLKVKILSISKIRQMKNGNWKKKNYGNDNKVNTRRNKETAKAIKKFR